MKKVKFTARIVMLILVAVLGFQVFAACGKDPVEEEVTVTAADVKNLSQSVTLDMAVFENKDARITYTKADEWNALDGKSYRSGDIKPVWAKIQTNLNVVIKDAASNYEKRDLLYDGYKAKNFDGADFIVLTAENAVLDSREFLDLKPYLDKGLLPNFAAQMEKTDIITQSVITGGKMFYVPYFDGFDDIERMMIMRSDWVKKLLDSETVDSFDTQVVSDLGFTYQPFMGAYNNKQLKIVDPADNTKVKTITKNVTTAQNIIAQMNAAEDKSGKNLAALLRDYIDATYGDLYGDNRSDLFVSGGAAYDTDELIALLKVVKANPAYLTGSASTNIVPIFPREATNQRTNDLFRLAQIFGLRGTESRLSYFYVDKDGNLQDSRLQEDTYEVLDILNKIYNDGLILKDFSKDSAVAANPIVNTGDNSFRGRLVSQNRGFMTYDYNQTTTVLNSVINDSGNENYVGYADFELLPVIAPFTTWDGEIARHTDSWRSVKNSGWAINADVKKDKAKLARSLYLVDYLFSEEGNRLMSYGPDEWINGTIEYMGKQIPKVSDAAKADIKTKSAGNYTNYYRQYLGATMPIGYIKEQGMEYQVTHAAGQVGLDNILNAIKLGTMTHLVVDSSEIGTNKALQSVPSALPLTSTQTGTITTKTATFTTIFSSEGTTYNNVIARIIIGGYGITGGPEVGTPTKANAVAYYKAENVGGDIYLTNYKDAFDALMGINNYAK